MHFFRVRLILALIAVVTVVSAGSTYFDVLAHKHILGRELERRTTLLGASFEPQLEPALSGNRVDQISAQVNQLRARFDVLGLAVFNAQGRLLAFTGPQDVANSLSPKVVERAASHGAKVANFSHNAQHQWLEDAIPLRDGSGQMNGIMAILVDASFIRADSMAVWQRSFWWIAAVCVLIIGVTWLIVSLSLTRPMTRFAERLRRLRMGHATADEAEENVAELAIFRPLAREVETLAESLAEARAAAQNEARMRDAGEHHWTPERLAVHVRERFGSSRIFVVSNREPYMHVKKGRETVCVVPPSGLVTAIEPVLRACDGVWIAHGSGSEDRVTVDEFDRIRVPPDDPRYSLRRVWLSAEEEAGYYDGFANEGLWPLCHIAHTRPIFRASDWACYQRVNQKFADALLSEMEGSRNPVVLIQDYHFALAPRLVKVARPDARVAIFWHIPWPNPEAFGICPWQAELLDGLLGADLIGFHIPLHCNNFMSTIDRVLEARTDREHMTARRRGHLSTVRPYPVSVALTATPSSPALALLEPDAETAALRQLRDEFNVRCDAIALGVDRLDYTQGIEERLLAIEELMERHPEYRERLTMVQIAAPSRTRIASYAELRKRVEETVQRINLRFQTPRWRPIVLIDRQCDHQEVDQWYKAAAVCMVTSLHDGMNLVAKEYLAARSDEDGALVLSKFTGAAVELSDALLVNPYDIEAVATAIHQGLEMDRSERRTRMQRMRKQVMEYNVYRWAADLLDDLRELRIEESEPAEPGRFQPKVIAVDSSELRRRA